MQSQQQRNSNFMITKEVFINHLPHQIEKHYDINPNCLGEGGFGKVFEGRKKNESYKQLQYLDLQSSFSSFQTCARSCEDEPNNNEVRAVKRIAFKRQEDKELMRNQIEILSYLDHPTIVKLYETYEHKKQLFLVTDLFTGGDLFSLVNERTEVKEDEVKIIFKQIVRALSYLHAQHICHRDLKLQNILLLDQDSLNIKIVDFGLAYCWDQNMKAELKRSGQNVKIAGTSDYMSPQMISHKYDERCDIWSAGVILYILLSGVPPFSGKNDKEIINRIKNYSYDFQIPEFDNISAQAIDLLTKILKPEEQRVSLQQILNHPWLNSKSLESLADLQTATQTSTMKFTEKVMDFNEEKPKRFISFDKIKKKSSLNLYDRQSCFSSKGRSYYSEDWNPQDRGEQLTIQKLQYYKGLSKLQKFFGVFSVSRLSQTKTKQYGHQFMRIDKNNDGSVCLQDLKQYLLQNEGFTSMESIQVYFDQVALSRRGYISYTQYLACVLSYQSLFQSTIDLVELQFEEKIPRSRKHSFFSESMMCFGRIDIFNDSFIGDLFSMLDKDGDEMVTAKDFFTLLQSNGINDQNIQMLKEIQAQISQLSKVYEIQQQYETQEVWCQDFNKFKELLSRTYKGQKDGGKGLSLRKFRYLLMNNGKILN